MSRIHVWFLLVVGALLLFTALVGLAAKALWWVLFGALAGGLARLLLIGERPIGVLATILAGVGGALTGGLAAHALGVGNLTQFGIAVAVAALLVMAIGIARRRWAELDAAAQASGDPT